MIKEFSADNLKVKVFETRIEMGELAAKEAVECIKKLLAEKDKAQNRVYQCLFQVFPVSQVLEASRE